MSTVPEWRVFFIKQNQSFLSSSESLLPAILLHAQTHRFVFLTDFFISHTKKRSIVQIVHSKIRK